MLCKPSFPTPHCQAVDANKDIILQCMHNFGVVGDCDFTIYNAMTSKKVLKILSPVSEDSLKINLLSSFESDSTDSTRYYTIARTSNNSNGNNNSYY